MGVLRPRAAKPCLHPAQRFFFAEAVRDGNHERFGHDRSNNG
jgi:hypothetical protein